MSSEDGSILDVVVVGAGVAGLAAAHHLRSRGISSVVVLEARSRCGGRVASTTKVLPKVPLPTGANFIHGETNPIYSLATQKGVSMKADEWPQYVYFPPASHSGGRIVRFSDPTDPDMAKLRDLIAVLASDDLGEALEARKLNNGANDSQAADDINDASQHQSFASSTSADGSGQYTGAEGDDNHDDDQDNVAATLQEFFDENAEDPLHARAAAVIFDNDRCTSAAAAGFWDCVEAEQSWRHGDQDYVCAEGLDFYVEHLARHCDVRLDHVVSRIEGGAEAPFCRVFASRTSNASNGSSQVILRCKAVIVTVPLPVLQAGNVEFEPPMPEPWRQALHTITSYPAMKLFMVFDEECWDPDVRTLSCVDSIMPDLWFFDEYSTSFADGSTRHVVIGFAGGPRVEEYKNLQESTESQDGDEPANVDESWNEILPWQRELTRRTLKQMESIFPGSTPHEHLRRVVCFNWGDDPYALGGYTSPSPGSTQAREVLRAPQWQGSLFFAGEGVAEGHDVTVQGAVETGQIAALQVAFMLDRK